MGSLVQIQLIDTNQGYLDLAEGTNFPINFGISDVRDLTKRKGTTSKTIKLAGSKNNNKLLNNYFDVNVIAGSFDINILQRCAVIQDGIVILDDVYLQLTKVVKEQTTGAHDQLVSYECVIKDSTSDFFTKIGNNELTDLQLQSAETYHLYTSDNVVASWNHTWVDTYKYVMPINTITNNYTLNQFVPGIYAKVYWDKIFEAAGYTYEWEGHTGTTQQFDKLIVPFNGDQSELTSDILEDLQIIADNTGSTEYTYAQATNGTAILFEQATTFPNEIQDIQGYYNPATSTYTNAFYLQGSNTLQYEYEIDYEFILRNQAGSTATAVVGTNYNAYVKITKNGNAASYNNLSILGTAAGVAAGGTIPAGDTVLSSGVVTRTLQLSNLNVGDYHNYKFLVIPNGGGVSAWDKRVDLVLKINSITMKIVPKIEMLGYTFPVFLNTFVPKKIKQSDYIKAFVTRYNLYIEIDPFDNNNLIIKTRDNYYDSGKEENWTKLLNKENEQELQFLPELSKKKFKLTDKQDNKDEALSIYFETTTKIYGESQFKFDNEYTKDIEIKETIFSPTIITDENIFGAVTPSITGPNPKINIRLLYDGGMFDCNSWYIYDYATTGTSGMTQYPLFSHQDSPTAPTFDINFGQCGYYAIENLGLTNNNMYNLHWRRTLNQMNTSKMLTAYFDLKASDIQKMKLSDKIRIDNSWWNINKIVDFNPTKEGPTKVELLSIDNDTQFSPFNTWVPPVKPTKPVVGPIKPIKGSWHLLDKGLKNIDRNGLNFSNIINGNIGVVYGSNNFVGDSSTNGVIYGDNNIGDFGGFILGDNNTSNSNTFIYGSDNYIPEGMGNSMIIGNGITADTANTMYASNITVVNNLTLQSGATFDMSGLTITGLDYLPLSGGAMDTSAIISSANDGGSGGGKLSLDYLGVGDDLALYTSPDNIIYFESGNQIFTTTGAQTFNSDNGHYFNANLIYFNNIPSTATASATILFRETSGRILDSNILLSSISDISSTYLPITGGTVTEALVVNGNLTTGGNLTSDDFEQVSHVTLQTTNATVTTIKTIPISNEYVYQIESNICSGINDTSKGFTSKLVGSFKNNGGTVTQIGTTNEIVNSDFTGTAEVTMTISGTDVLIRVTGEAATTIDWGSSIIINRMEMGVI
jgi:hypothetical protein